jgi:hypothetical protein
MPTADERDKGLQIRVASRDHIEQAMMERLVQIGRVEPDFDPVTWYEDKCSVKANQQQKSEQRLALGIHSAEVYKDAIKAQKLTPAFVLHMEAKPKRRIPAAWHTKKEQLTIEFYTSTPYACQAQEEIQTLAQSEHAEGDRLLTYLFYAESGKQTNKKRGKGTKEKGSTAPEDTETAKYQTQDEE